MRPLPPDILRVIELGRRGLTLREIAEELGVSYGYLRKRLSLLRRAGYDVPRFRRGRRGNNSKPFHGMRGFTQKMLPSAGGSKKFSRSEKCYPPRKGSRVNLEKVTSTIRLGRDGLIPHIVSIVLSEGAVYSGVIKRRLRMWGYRFSNSTFWRAYRKLELYGFIVVERKRGFDSLLRPSKKLLQAAMRGFRSSGHGSLVGGNISGRGVGESVVAYVENACRRWEYGFEFRGLRLDHVRWLQVYGRRGWFRFEFHPRRGEEADYYKAVRDLLRVAAAVGFALGLPYMSLAEMLAEEYARFR